MDVACDEAQAHGPERALQQRHGDLIVHRAADWRPIAQLWRRPRDDLRVLDRCVVHHHEALPRIDRGGHLRLELGLIEDRRVQQQLPCTPTGTARAALE